MYQRPKSSDCLVISVGRSGISVSLDIRNMLSPFYVVTIGEVRSKVSAATFRAPQRGARDHQTHGHDAAHTLKSPVGSAYLHGRSDQRVPGVEPCDHLVEAAAIAQQATMPPHQP